MPHIRMSLMTPKHGHADDVAQIMEDLLKFYRSQPGFIDGYTLRSADEIGDVGRVTIWRTAADTDAAAQTPHVLSTRSDLLPLIAEDSHIERSFHADQPVGVMPSPAHEA